MFYIYEEQALKIKNELKEWQYNQIEKHAIDVNTNKRKKQGVEAVFTKVTGFINNDWRYSKLDEALINKVKNQIAMIKFEYNSEKLNLYQEDIQLLIRDGKTYLWLPEK